MSCESFQPSRRSPLRKRVPVRAHVGTAAQFLSRHVADVTRAYHSHGCVPMATLGDLHHRVADDRSIRLAIEHVQRGGLGAGVDEIRVDEHDHLMWMSMADAIRDALTSGRYRPEQDRLARIPKLSSGYRWLSIPTVPDRVVQRSMLQIIEPIVDLVLEPGVAGGRSGKSVYDALAMAELDVRRGNHVLVVADIRKAFDRVPHQGLLTALRAHLGRTPLMNMLTRCIRAHRRVGIGQGGPLSMLLLNVYLDVALDKPFRALHPNLRLIRYVDDLLVACPDRETAKAVLKDLRVLHEKAKMPLKSNPPPAVVDFRRGESTRWLGYRISSGPSGLEPRIDESAWDYLGRTLADAHRLDQSGEDASQVISGWMQHYGPCLPYTDLSDACDRIVRAVEWLDADVGLDRRAVGGMWKVAYTRYQGALIRHSR